MKELVFVDNTSIAAEPYTTSAIVAECAQVQHHTITRLLRTHRKDFELFGVYGFEIHKPTPNDGVSPFEMRKPPAGNVGGRPVKVYRLNEQQATLLITYLQNTKPVVAFKINLVREFYRMKQYISRQRKSRQEIKPVTRCMTDAIRDNTPPDKLNQHTYTNYIKLAYKMAFGMPVEHLRELRCIPKDATLADYFSVDELEQVKKIENIITALLDAGMDYQSIKATLAQVHTLQLTA